MENHGMPEGRYVYIPHVNILPELTGFDHGKLFLLNTTYESENQIHPKGLYYFNRYTMKYHLILEDSPSLCVDTLTMMNTLEVSLTKQDNLSLSDHTQSVELMNIILPEHSQYCHFSLKGYNSGVANGFVFFNKDTGKILLKFDNTQIQWNNNVIWNASNFNPKKVQPITTSVVVQDETYTTTSHNQRIIIDTTYQTEKYSHYYINIPKIPTNSSYIEILIETSDEMFNVTINAEEQQFCTVVYPNQPRIVKCIGLEQGWYFREGSLCLI